MKVAIVGLGYVGTAMNKLFAQAVVYDEPKGVGSRDEVNECEAAFVCVPTPAGVNGACDTSVVDDVLGWLDTDVIILRSTVPVGFTERMCAKTGKNIVFQPEYCGETADHPYGDLSELAKYMENCYLAAKVTFCNEFYDIAQKAGVSYTELRETWLMDERMGRSHTFVYPDKRGYDGKCLPKDVAALIAQADELGVDVGFMKAVREKNEKYR